MLYSHVQISFRSSNLYLPLIFVGSATPCTPLTVVIDGDYPSTKKDGGPQVYRILTKLRVSLKPENARAFVTNRS